MEKEYVNFDATNIKQNLSKMDLHQIQNKKEFCEKKLGENVFPVQLDNEKWYEKDYFVSLLNAIEQEIANRTTTAQEMDVPATIEEIPIPNMEKETAPETSNAGETNVNENLQKESTKSPKLVDKPKKNCYISGTNKTKTTKTGVKTMISKNEIAKIAPVAVKNIIAAQKTNKTDIKKTYWGGWATVRNGMKSASNDYAKYDVLQTEWHGLCEKLGGTKSPLYHFCWKLINKNRVGVKQEPNATLRFIKNAKIRIAMANDVLANKNKYKNEIAENWKATFGTEI